MKLPKGQRLTPEQRIERRVLSRFQRSDTQAYNRALQYNVQVEFVSRIEVLKRDGHTCYLCGGWLSVHELNIEHVVPLHRGGSHTYNNIRLAHARCNSRKGKRLLEEITDLSEWECGGTRPPKTCPACGNLFESRTEYCSRECYTTCRKKLRPKTCRVCHSQFEPKRSGTIYCARECSNKGLSKTKQTLIPKACRRCSAPFEVRLSDKLKDYCSRKCGQEAKGEAVSAARSSAPRRVKPVDYVCELCGTAFQAIPRKRGRRFCSTKCTGAYLAKGIRDGEFVGNPSTKITAICEKCGEAYRVVKAREGKTRFCSMACRQAWWAATIAKRNPRLHVKWLSKTCERCGRNFNVKPSMASQRFCSRVCADLANRLPPGVCNGCGKTFRRSTSYVKNCSRRCYFGQLTMRRPATS
jgi:hypothetical protein